MVIEVDRFLRIGELIAVTGLSRSTLHRLGKSNDLPAKVRLSSRAVAWRASEIQAWIESRQEVGRA